MGRKKVFGFEDVTSMTKDQLRLCKHEAKKLYPKKDYIGREQDRTLLIHEFLCRCDLAARRAMGTVSITVR